MSRKKKLARLAKKEPKTWMFYMFLGGMLIIFLMLLMSGNIFTSKDKGKRIEETIGYMKRLKGVISMKTVPATNTITLVYDSNEKTLDLDKVLTYAAIKLDNEFGKDEPFTILLCADQEKNIVRKIKAQNSQLQPPK